MLKRHNSEIYIRSTKDPSQFWQCGVWVVGERNATRYIDRDAAEKVIALRSLHNVEIIEK